MNVNKLDLHNFRGIREMSLDFSEGMNVLVGVNGAGKSSVLDSLAIMLSRLIGRIRSTSGTGHFFTELDISEGENATSNSVGVTFEGEAAEWLVSKSRKGRKRQTITNQSDLRRIVDKIHEELAQDPNKSIPLCVNYTVNRAVLDVPLRIRTRHEFGQLAAYDAALSGKRNDFRLFFEWFRGREDLENERLRDDPSAGKDSYLDAVRSAVEAFTDFRELRVRRQPLRMEVRKEGERFTIQQLSDGEKCLLALIGDLARRLAIANPGLDEPLKGKGVVLIDEIDLHLHPAWQRKVIQKLPKVFPNCQFIVSTHSPQVISHVKPEQIFLLRQTDEGIVCSKPEESYGKNTDRILEDLMDTDARPKQVEDKLHRLFVAIEKGKLKAAKQQLLRIAREIGKDPELVRAEVLIKRKELIGK